MGSAPLVVHFTIVSGSRKGRVVDSHAEVNIINALGGERVKGNQLGKQMSDEQQTKQETQERKRRPASADAARTDLTHAQLLEIAQLSQKFGGLPRLKAAIEAYEKLAELMKHDLRPANPPGAK